MPSIRLLIVFFAGLLLIPGGPARGEQAKAKEPKTPRCRVWCEKSTQKVFKEDDAPLRLGRARARLAAARGETEAVQIVLRPSDDIQLTTATLSTLTGPGGATIPTENVQLLRVGYVYLEADNRAWPDPLPPLTLPQPLRKDQTQPLWLSVRVPREAAPGQYTGHLLLGMNAGKRQCTVPIELTVWPFEIPLTPSTSTAFGIDYLSILRQHDAAENSPQGAALKRAYYEFLVERRLSPYFIPCVFDSPEAAQYLDDPRVTSFVIPWSQDEAELTRTLQTVRQHNWLDKGFFYVVDEPATLEQYRLLEQTSKQIWSLEPNAKIISPFFSDPSYMPGKTAYDILVGKINLWCVKSSYYQAGPITRAQERGQEAWWYVCCYPLAPYANFMVDWDGVAPRALFWQQKQRGLNGCLYWNTTWWDPAVTRDPWTSICTFRLPSCDFYGDGSLVYPGAQVGVDGPVSSIRLETIRDGLEDYEYLTQYEALAGSDALDKQTKRVSRSLTKYTHSPARLESVRRTLARRLSEKE